MTSDFPAGKSQSVSNAQEIEKAFVQTIFQTSTWKVFSIIKNISFITKNLTDFRKTVETDVDPCLLEKF